MGDHAEHSDFGDSESIISTSFPIHSPMRVCEHDDDDESYHLDVHTEHSLVRRPTKGPIRTPVDYSSFLCGFLAGVAQAGIFNPYDRALYLSVKEKRNFLNIRNWQHPYSGFFQSLGGRVISGGLYFPVEHLFLRLMDKEQSHPYRNFLAGTAAGLVNAIVLNPLTAIKYKTWGKTEKLRALRAVGVDVDQKRRTMIRTASGMIRKAGSLRPFFNGLAPTVYRDVVFGGCYTWLRLQIQWWLDLQPNEQYIGNFVAAGLATVASGPFNYARNIQYATSSRDRAQNTVQILQELMEQVAKEKTAIQKWSLLQNRLRIGWGTARVALGMTFAHSVYDTLQKSIKHYPQYSY